MQNASALFESQYKTQPGGAGHTAGTEFHLETKIGITSKSFRWASTVASTTFNPQKRIKNKTE
jgi:hypothetical protein